MVQLYTDTVFYIIMARYFTLSLSVLSSIGEMRIIYALLIFIQTNKLYKNFSIPFFFCSNNIEHSAFIIKFFPTGFT
ncbi:MAG: hypothetical protein BWY38_00452 [Ignavibacteria bacterium ADurb.Bin266]|nr:MAG: hypothetical protein BWY38_00452 [Ignavibacteria bacterium ADurb.Bin266]